MKGEWCYQLGAFTAEECANIIQMGLRLPKHSATIGENSNPADDGFRRSIIRWVDMNTNPEFSWVFQKFWQLMLVINRDWYKFNITHLPPLQLTEYDESYRGEYKSHQDVFWISESPNHRKTSLVVQLSHPSQYEGGILRLEHVDGYPTDADYEAMKSIGTAISFPSFVYHRLEPVTKGTRYSLVGWFEGPKFQ